MENFKKNYIDITSHNCYTTYLEQVKAKGKNLKS